MRRKWLLTVQKRDGRKVKFDKDKIKIAVLKPFIDGRDSGSGRRKTDGE